MRPTVGKSLEQNSESSANNCISVSYEEKVASNKNRRKRKQTKNPTAPQHFVEQSAQAARFFRIERPQQGGHNPSLALGGSGGIVLVFAVCQRAWQVLCKRSHHLPFHRSSACLHLCLMICIKCMLFHTLRRWSRDIVNGLLHPRSSWSVDLLTFCVRKTTDMTLVTEILPLRTFRIAEVWMLLRHQYNIYQQ